MVRSTAIVKPDEDVKLYQSKDWHRPRAQIAAGGCHYDFPVASLALQATLTAKDAVVIPKEQIHLFASVWHAHGCQTQRSLYAPAVMECSLGWLGRTSCCEELKPLSPLFIWWVGRGF